MKLLITLLCCTAAACRPRADTSETKVVRPLAPTDAEKIAAVGIMTIERAPNCRSTERIVYTCGATRIGKHTIVTAAHCLTTTSGVPPERVLVWKNAEELHSYFPNRSTKDCRDLEGPEMSRILSYKAGYEVATRAAVLKYFPDKYAEGHHVPSDLGFLKVNGNIPQVIVELDSSPVNLPVNRAEAMKRNLFIVGPGTNNCFDSQHPENFHGHNATKYGFGKLALLNISQSEMPFFNQGFENSSSSSLLDWKDGELMIPKGGSLICNGDSGSGLISVTDGKFLLRGTTSATTGFAVDNASNRIKASTNAPANGAVSTQLILFSSLQNDLGCELLRSEEDVKAASPAFFEFCRATPERLRPLEQYQLFKFDLN